MILGGDWNFILILRLDSAGGTPTLKLNSIAELLKITEELLEVPSGAGLEVPSWLIALEEEIELLRYPDYIKHDEKRLREVIPQTKLSYEELQQQLTWWLEQQ